MTKKSVQQVQAILGSPFVGDLPANALKVRRNLIATSLIAITLLFTGAKLDPHSAIFGIRFTDLNVEWIPSGLLILTVYFFIHYLWYAIEALAEWRLRLTGTKLVYQTAARVSSEEGDYPNDPRQSTLYSWWLKEATKVGQLGKPINAMEQKIAVFEKQVSALQGDSNGLNFSQATTNLSSIKSDISSLKRQIEATSKIIESARIPASLERFDKWFSFSLRAQSLRWLVLDLIFPMLFGLFAGVLLLNEIVAY